MLQHRPNSSPRTTAGGRIVRAILASALISFLILSTAQGQTFTVIHHFTGGSDGANPIAGVTVDAAGNLYGTASAGGRRGYGDVYRLVHSGPGWLFSLVYTFLGDAVGDGISPQSRVVIGPGGFLYGTTRSGGGGDGCRERHGCGTVFRVKPKPGASLDPWQETVLYSFGTYDGSDPYYGDVVFDAVGNLYGTTRDGGAYLQGVVYELTPQAGMWKEQVLYSFAGTPDGSAPMGGVAMNQAGVLFGTTSAGGMAGWGAVYQLRLSASGWTESVLYSFEGAGDGETPIAGVVVGPSGVLYGATLAGGINGGGTVLALTPGGGSSWDFSTLYGFGGSGGPYGGLIADQAGNLYGTTSGDGAGRQGSVFKLTLSSGQWMYTSLHDFTGGLDGGTPYGGLALDANGNLYGTASVGGAYGNGVVFQVRQ